MKCLRRLSALIALGAGLLLCGCAEPGNTRHASPARSHGSRPAVSSPLEHPAAKLPQSTGIAACDDYLASYKGCHLAAHVYAPGQIEAHYQAMRTSLLRDSQDPAIRPQLAARCNALARQLRTVLRDRPCSVEPATAPNGHEGH